ncbi:hypothetical protein [Methylomicrobium lacus]|uniref:hypothetical protein n=1 Tax=Methylomicrobium lacus TaxID=136992 RepID=UPI0035A93270
MKRIIYKVGVISFLLAFSGWQGAYAEEAAVTQSQEFVDLIWHDHIVLYALFCGLVSILVKIVDYVIANQIDETNLNTPQQEIMNQAMPLLGWFASAAIVGYLAVIAGFFTTEPQTAVMVGLGWPMVYVRLKKLMEERYPQTVTQTAGNLPSDGGKA